MSGNGFEWRHALEDAKTEARTADKLILVDLFNPQ